VRYTDVYPHFISVPLCARLQWYTCTTLSGVECQKFFRCEAPLLHRHEIGWTIMPSPRAQKPWTQLRI